MTRGPARNAELGAFLRARRTGFARDAAGLPPTPRGGTTGLRREEVAYLSGVSVTWYTWLEQGRDVSPSRQVLVALAAALRLEPAESDYLLGLAGLAPSPPRHTEAPVVADHVQRLLDSLVETPAFALTADWDIAGWNEAYARLFPPIGAIASSERNLLILLYTEESVRELVPDWEATVAQFLADFRASMGPRLDSGRHAELLRRLSGASPLFREHWARHDVGRFASRTRTFRHPEHGIREYEQHLLRPSDQPDVEIVVYRPLPGESAYR